MLGANLTSLFKKWIIFCNVLLDTTPRQWIYYYAEVFGMRFSSFAEFKRYILSIFAGRQSFFITGSGVLHGLILAGVSWYSGGSELDIVNKQTIKTQSHISSSRAGDVEPEHLEITGIYYVDARDLKASSEKPPNSKLASIFKKVKNFGTPTKALKNSEVTRTNISTSLSKKNSQIAWEKIAADQETKSGDDNEAFLSRHLAQYNPHFQKCYEKALLSDTSLNAKIEFKLRIGPDLRISQSHIDLNGVGSTAAKATLESCLVNVTKTIIFPPNDGKPIIGKDIKFYVVLDSWG
jgi:hypothetical protein